MFDLNFEFPQLVSNFVYWLLINFIGSEMFPLAPECSYWLLIAPAGSQLLQLAPTCPYLRLVLPIGLGFLYWLSIALIGPWSLIMLWDLALWLLFIKVSKIFSQVGT